MTYADRQPWVWALEILPAYDAVARVKQGAHWQTDVIAGWALDTGFGYFAAKNESPFVLSILPHGFMVGLIPLGEATYSVYTLVVDDCGSAPADLPCRSVDL